MDKIGDPIARSKPPGKKAGKVQAVFCVEPDDSGYSRPLVNVLKTIPDNPKRLAFLRFYRIGCQKLHRFQDVKLWT